MKNIKLAPSILSADFARLGEDIRQVEKAGAHFLHVDVMDGMFVPNISLGIPVLKSIRRVTNMVLDVHLMINEPLRYVNAFAEAGADIICIHAETCKDLSQALKEIRKIGKKAAAAINPATPEHVLFDALPEMDMALVMSVVPGFGGQEMITDTLFKAERLRNFIQKNGLDTDIEMDGGITLENAETVIRAGVNIVVAGSSVFGAADISNRVRDFYRVFAKDMSYGGGSNS